MSGMCSSVPQQLRLGNHGQMASNSGLARLQDGFDMKSMVMVHYGLDLVNDGGNLMIIEHFHGPKLPGDGD